MKRPRPAQSFESFEEMADYLESQEDAHDAEEQAADDACSEPDE